MPEDKWRTIPESAKTIFEHPLQGDPTVILSQTGLIRPDEELYKSMSAVISTFTPQELAIYNAIHPISVL
jgi:hypothetical protein